MHLNHTFCIKIKSHFKLVYGVFSIEAWVQINSYAFSKFLHSIRARCFSTTPTLYKNTDLPHLSQDFLVPIYQNTD